MSRYQHPLMKQLTDQQVRYAPRDVRLQQLDRAERLLSDLDGERSYTYGELCAKITDYHPENYAESIIEGAEAIHDLRCFIEDLSDSANISVDSIPEEVMTVADVSREFKVSTKTVDRWRERGLPSRKLLFGNRKRVGFLRSTVDRFVRQHSQDVNRGSRFRQLDDSEKLEIIRMAREMAQSGDCLSDITQRLAKKLSRSPETIRYTIKNYDTKHPENAIFPDRTAPLTDAARRDLYRRFRRGTSIEKLCREFHRTRSSIHRIASEVRAEIILDQTVSFMDSEEFQLPNADELILGAPPETDKKEAAVKVPPGLPPYLASLYEIALLTKEEEVYFFRKFNYLKFKAAQLQQTMREKQPRTALMDEFEELMQQAQKVKNHLIRCNLRLVVSIAKRHYKPQHNFFEMVSDGNMSLIRAIEKFDYMKGNKFSTYASWAIMKNYARSIPAEHKILDRFRTGNEEVFSFSEDDGSNAYQEELFHQHQQEAVKSILDQLDEREREIITSRFGLRTGTEPQTLEQVGTQFGVTKERIRQIEARALKKLKRIAMDEHIDVPGI